MRGSRPSVRTVVSVRGSGRSSRSEGPACRSRLRVGPPGPARARCRAPRPTHTSSRLSAPRRPDAMDRHGLGRPAEARPSTWPSSPTRLVSRSRLPTRRGRATELRGQRGRDVGSAAGALGPARALHVSARPWRAPDSLFRSFPRSPRLFPGPRRLRRVVPLSHAPGQTPTRADPSHGRAGRAGPPAAVARPRERAVRRLRPRSIDVATARGCDRRRSSEGPARITLSPTRHAHG